MTSRLDLDLAEVNVGLARTVLSLFLCSGWTCYKWVIAKLLVWEAGVSSVRLRGSRAKQNR